MRKKGKKKDERSRVGLVFRITSHALVCSGCSVTEYHRLGGFYMAEIYCSQLWWPDVRGQVLAWSGEGPLQVAGFSLCLHMADLSGASL